jgi:hypothetical protein
MMMVEKGSWSGGVWHGAGIKDHWPWNPSGILTKDYNGIARQWWRSLLVVMTFAFASLKGTYIFSC